MLPTDGLSAVGVCGSREFPSAFSAWAQSDSSFVPLESAGSGIGLALIVVESLRGPSRWRNQIAPFDVVAVTHLPPLPIDDQMFSS